MRKSKPSSFLIFLLFSSAIFGAAALPSKPRKFIECDVLGLELRMEETLFREKYGAATPEEFPEAEARFYRLGNETNRNVKEARAFFYRARLVRVETEYSADFVGRTDWFGWASKYTRRYGQCLFTQEDTHPPFVTDVATWQDGRARLEIRHQWETDRRRNFKLNSRFWTVYTDKNCPPQLQRDFPR